MSGVACYFLTEVERVRRHLRRFTGHERGIACPGPYGYCNASAVLDELPYPLGVIDCTCSPLTLDDVPPRGAHPWPIACPYCERRFDEDDEWQVNGQRLYLDPRSGRTLTWEEAGPGAMRDCWWHPRKGPDGRYLEVKLPDGQGWHIDGPSQDGPGWTRTGAVPRITVKPSILTRRYHGHLIDGVLVPC